MTRRRRALGDGPPRTTHSHESWSYIVFWRSPGTEKGTIWVWCSPEMTSYARLRHDEAIPWRATGYRIDLLRARGVNWTATWVDGTTHKFKASPQATRPVMAQIAQRWAVAPVTLQREKGRAFDLATLVEESHSHVYLVRLLTFDPTADGRTYYKIGKAISIPKRIKQFGPCELIAEARLPSEIASLTVEAQLHEKFAQWRRPQTEIFCFSAAQLEVVKAAMAVVSGSGSLGGVDGPAADGGGARG